MARTNRPCQIPRADRVAAQNAKIAHQTTTTTTMTATTATTTRPGQIGVGTAVSVSAARQTRRGSRGAGGSTPAAALGRQRRECPWPPRPAHAWPFSACSRSCSQSIRRSIRRLIWQSFRRPAAGHTGSRTGHRQWYVDFWDKRDGAGRNCDGSPPFFAASASAIILRFAVSFRGFPLPPN